MTEDRDMYLTNTDAICPACGKPYVYVGYPVEYIDDYICTCWKDWSKQADMTSHVCQNCGKPIGDSCLCWLTEYALKVSSDDANLYAVISDQQAEIARLRAELEEAEMKIEQLMEAGRQQEVEIGGLIRAGTWVMEERDEARKWARRLYKNVRIQEQLIYHLMGRDEDGE